jgi:hypothetical protein
LLLEELERLGAQHHVPWAQFDRPAFSMSETQCVTIEIRHDCGRNLLRPGTRELKSPKESTRARRGCGNDCLSLSGIKKHGGLTTFLKVI